ncbi:MAG: hypothetical protein NTW45_02775 [Rhodocyclales bacterium]|nr:hypothetical protein [Rhodocyclales bacterium]
MHNAITFVLALSVGVNVLSLNYAIGTLLDLSGQSVSLAVNLACVACVVHHVATEKTVGLLSSSLWITILTVLIVPLIGYLINYHGQDSVVFVFWLKRSALIIVTLIAAVVLLVRLPSRWASVFSEFILVLNCATILYSYFNPNEALIFFTAEMEEWGDLESISTGRAFGTSINPNDAAFSLVACYLVCQIVIQTGRTRIEFWHRTVLDAFVIGTLVLTGSRAIVLLGVICILLTTFYAYAEGAKALSIGSSKLIKQRAFYVILVGLSLVLLMAFLLAGDDETGAFRVVSFLTSTQSEEALESTSLRLDALVAGLQLIFENPLTGVGFEDSATLLFLLPHNTFVYYFANNGIILGLMYLAFIYAIFIKPRKKGHRVMLSICLLFILGASFFMHTLLDSKQLPWLVAALIGLGRGQQGLQRPTRNELQAFAPQ